MKVSIAIVCSNDHLIKKCLKSIPKKTPVIMVLNYPDEFVLKEVSNKKNIKVYNNV